MTAEDIIAAFGVEVHPTRIAKKDLIELGAATAADRKLIETAVERLDWMATLSSASIGVAAGGDDERPVPAIQLLLLSVRAEPAVRLLTVIHRAIPVPVVIVSRHGVASRISLAPLRRAERVGGAMVVERLITSPALVQRDTASEAFVASLAVGTLPRTDLAAVYEALVWRIEALIAARVGGGDFRLPVDAAQATARRAILAEHDAVTAEWTKLRAAAGGEKSLSKQVALAETARLVKTRLDGLQPSLR